MRLLPPHCCAHPWYFHIVPSSLQKHTYQQLQCAARYQGGKLSDEVGSVILQDTCQQMAFVRSTGLLVAVTSSGMVAYNVVADGDTMKFVVPQVCSAHVSSLGGSQRQTYR